MSVSKPSNYEKALLDLDFPLTDCNGLFGGPLTGVQGLCAWIGLDIKSVKPAALFCLWYIITMNDHSGMWPEPRGEDTISTCLCLGNPH